MSTTKKPAKKQQDPPAADTQMRTEEPEPVRPMAAPEPTIEDRVAALERAVLKVDEFCTKHNRYHFGGLSQG